MINYVNNAFDNTLKPCTAKVLDRIISAPETTALVMAYRVGNQEAKRKLPALTFAGVLDTETYVQYREQCAARKEPAKGNRNTRFMQPTGLMMLDFDHVENPHELYRRVLDTLYNWHMPPQEHLALAHITPSGKGLRLVLRSMPGQTIEQQQGTWSRALDIVADEACKDISRLSFCPMQSDILYRNDTLLFAPLPETQTTTQTETQTETQTTTSNPMSDNTQHPMTPTLQHDTEQRTNAPTFPKEYHGTPYATIVGRLEEVLGGAPQMGNRHTTLMAMAAQMRYICENNPAWLRTLLPTYDLPETEVQRILSDACQYKILPQMPMKLKTALGTPDKALAHTPTHAPRMPKALPPSMQLLLSNTPNITRQAVAMAVFPSLGTHLQQVTYQYADNRRHEPAFMNMLVAKQSSGKSSVDLPIDHIMADISKQDNIQRLREKQWREDCAMLGSNKDKPRQPRGPIQWISTDTTPAAFVNRLANAEGKCLYSRMNEVEQLTKLNQGGPHATMELLRLNFDRSPYGQERVGVQSVNEQVTLRMNCNISTTPARAREFFARQLTDGTLSRLSLCTIEQDEDDYGSEIPQFGSYDQDFDNALAPYIAHLCQAHGNILCTQAIEWARETQRQHASIACEWASHAYAALVPRAVQMGFYRAITLYIMQGMQWTQEIEDFASWSVEYDLWCKWKFYGDLLTAANEREERATQNHPATLLSTLPRYFTKEDVRKVRSGSEKSLDSLLRTWKCRMRIRYDEEMNMYENLTATPPAA